MPLAPAVDTLASQALDLRAAGRLDEAVVAMRRAASAQPANAPLQHDFGLICLEAGETDLAAGAFQLAIAIDPAFAAAHGRLGIALERQGDLEGAVAAYRRAVDLLPSLDEAQFRLGALLEAMGDRTSAAACFQRAAAAAPKGEAKWNAQARAAIAAFRDAEAERVLRLALRRDPTNATAQGLLGGVLADAGRFDEAAVCLEAAIAGSPRSVGLYYDLVRCRTITPADHVLLARMQTALEDASLGDAQRSRLWLAIGKARDDLGDYGQAMEAFDEAYAARARCSPFSLADFEAQVGRTIGRFDRARLAHPAPGSLDDSTPLLILGMPRSGTTLVEQILSCHPRVAAGGEMGFWPERAATLERSGPGEADRAARALGSDYLRVLRDIGGAAGRVTDKMPFNFLHIGLVRVALPGARIIHCRRAPVATALSIHQTHFAPALPFPTGGTDLVGYYRAYERLMDHWRATLPADRFVEVDYESLTEAPEANIRRIIDFAGLAWDDACLRPEHNRRVIRTPSKWQARQPIYRSAADGWRRYAPHLGALSALIPDPG